MVYYYVPGTGLNVHLTRSLAALSWTDTCIIHIGYYTPSFGVSSARACRDTGAGRALRAAMVRSHVVP